VNPGGQKLLAIFRAEHREHSEQIRLLIDRIRQADSPGEDLDEAFRRAHSLKGAARAVGIPDIESLGHRLEALFARVREGALQIDEAVAAVVHDAIDCSEDVLANLGGGPHVTAHVLAAIDRVLRIDDSGAGPLSDGPADPPRDAAASAEEPEGAAPGQEDASVRLRAAHVSRLLRTCDELLGAAAGQESLILRARELSREADGLTTFWARLRSSCAPQLHRLATEPDLRKLGRMLERLEARVRLAPARARRLLLEQQRNAGSVKRLSSQLHADVWQARSSGAESAFEGFGNMVRSLARSEGKQVRFRAVGLDAEADRDVLQALRDPVMHLLRNAVSHGIEPPSERIDAGKSETGQVTLSLEATAGRLTVRVSDDGRGVDLDRVEGEARRRGLLAEGPDREARLRGLIFAPGFSTATAVSEIAGRGMGLSVVEQSVRRLQGEIETASDPGRGTTMTIHTPLSVLMQRVLLVRAAGRVFALPLRAVERVLRASSETIEMMAGRPCVRTKEASIRAVSLAAVLGLPATESLENAPLALLRHADKRLALSVDELVEEREAFVKELRVPGSEGGPAVGGIPLENRTVAIVLSVPALIRASESVVLSPPAPSAPTPTERHKRRILLADDSLTTRALEKGILEVHGYEVLAAVDGAEALQVLRSQSVDLVISDVEMPRLNGFGLVEAMKDDARLSKIPIIMLTSMESPRDQEKGMALGVDAYILKRKFDQRELLETIQQIL
jgi:two-component system chemotaxis sensor kinase CheA